MSSLPFHLGLRDYRHMVSLIRCDGSGRTHLEIGTPYAASVDPRALVLEQWAMRQASPRRAMPATIDEPLSPRYQVALSARLNASVRHMLRGGLDPEPQGRRETVSGVKARLHLGRERVPIANGQPPLHRGPR